MKIAAAVLLACVAFALALTFLDSLGDDTKHAELDQPVPTVQGETPP